MRKFSLRHFITYFYALILCAFFVLQIMSCSNVEVEPNILPTLQEEGIDLTNPKLKTKNEAFGGQNEPHIQNEFFLKEQYEKDCHESVWFFCPPSIFSDEIWEFELVTDICVDPPKIIYMGDCEKKFDCDPANSEVKIIPCAYDQNTIGLKEQWCDKGIIKTGPCEACEDEVCNGLDDDCDGEIDEELLPSVCINECGQGELLCVNGEEVCYGEKPKEEICDYIDNDCDGEVDEDQLNACGLCGEVPVEVCNGIDDDCDGFLDEDMTQQCETDCGVGIEYCSSGQWIGCTAKEPSLEFCDGQDNDCDGLIDEDLDCLCTLQLVGALMPCAEPPLECGQGFKTCECANPECTEFSVTACFAACSYSVGISPGETCDIFKGMITFETCNNHDDNCNELIDEDLYQACYTGPPETVGIGLCKAGSMVCEAGQFGSFYEFEDGTTSFVTDLCEGEVLPKDTDECNGEDDNCDGKIDDGKELVDTDILFIVDASGSMLDDIKAVMAALNQFAVSYKDEEVIQWGLIFGPVKENNNPGGGLATPQYNKLITNLVSFSEFSSALASMSNYYNGYLGGKEAILDLLYLSIHNLVPFGNLPYQIDVLSYDYPTSSISPDDYYLVPDVQNFEVNWRDDSNRVIIIFSDEPMQSYLKMFGDTSDWMTIYDEYIQQQDILNVLMGTFDLKIYPFTPESLKDGTSGFGSGNYEIYATATGGKWYELSDITAEMYLNLMEIIGENACE